MTIVLRETVQGFDCVGLRSDAVEIRVLPGLGAKIFSLIDRRTSREWMWAPTAQRRLFRNALSDSFLVGPMVGADEIIPTISACPWRGLSIPGHGEAWREPWEFDTDAAAGGAIAARLRLPVSPLSIERRITLDGGRVLLQYRLTSHADAPLEYVWALHPLMTVVPGDELVLPPEVGTVRTDAAFNCDLGGRGASFEWPDPRPGMHLDRLDFGRENAAVKFFTAPLSQGWACIRNSRTGDAIRFSSDTCELNTLGIWISRGGLSGYHHTAIEPTNGAPDALDVAVNEWKRFAVVGPGQMRTWTLAIDVGGGA